jgi:hypothetical protein
MPLTVRVGVAPAEIIHAVKKMKRRQREAFLEDLLASTSPEYRKGIRQARADYRAGRIKTQREAFGR